MATVAEQDSSRRAGVFRVEEQGGKREKFAWVSGTVPAPGSQNGGARACPQGAWSIEAMLQTNRTEYPGATSPSEQVLGPRQEPQTFAGVFDDRYNYNGYAVETMRAFEDMCRRGTRVSVSFQAQAFIGIITRWKFDYKRSSEIGYEFTVSVHKRIEWVDHKPAENTTKTTIKSVTAVDEAVQKSLDELFAAKRGSMSGVEQSTREFMSAVSGARDSLIDTVDQQSINAADNPVVALKRIASAARLVRSSAHTVALGLAGARSDLNVTTKSALSVLDFEVWSRSMRASARLVMGESLAAAEAADERVDPEVKRLYRPFAGESLYSISTREYGTPHAWKIIADRNSLETMTLTGEEILLIPERGE